jgi:hypothetical protein
MQSMIPNESSVKKSEDGKSIEITFSTDGGEKVAISLLQGQVATLVSMLQKEILAGAVVPINRGSLRPGQVFETQAVQVGKHPSGARQIVFHVDLPEEKRHVTIPLQLSPEEVTSLIGELR